MHYFIYTTKDSYITEDSSGQIILYPDSKTRNFGGDEILEFRKDFKTSNSSSFTTGVTRISVGQITHSAPSVDFKLQI